MKAKQFKKRTDVPTKYKWDLESILEGKTIEQLLKEVKTIAKKLIKMKETKYSSKELFLAALKLEDKYTILNFKVENFLSNSISTNVVDPKANKINQEFEYIAYQITTEMGPELPRVLKNEKNIVKWIEDPKFKEYRNDYIRIFESKKHMQPKAIQEYRSVASRGDEDVSEIFSILTNSELDYGYATTTSGRKIKITTANRSKLAKHTDANVRKTAAKEYAKAYLRHKESLSNMLYQHFKAVTVSAKLSKFNKTIDALVYDDRSSEKLLFSLYDSVQNNLDVFGDYAKLHKKVYAAKYKKKITKYDWALPLVKVKSDYTVEEMQKTILSAFKPFGKEYTDQVKVAFKDRWIDYMAVDNKVGGAYSIGGTYGIDKKYILMNNDGTIRSVETLAHELGHSMHSYFADKHNGPRTSQYKIFVAEIASIFNELMLFDHLLTTSDDKKLKFKIRQQMAEGFDGTVLRQTLWSNYEYDLYRAIEEGKPVGSYEQISTIYYENSKKYATKKLPKFNQDKQWASIMVPHFYAGFYVYKYAIGQLVANIFFQRYKEEGPKALQDYIDNFLSVGGSMTPLETLKNAGVDLEDPKTYETGYASARENVKELKKLAKELFKIK